MTLSLPEFDASMTSITPPVAVATSGGPDSLALLLLAHKWGQEKGGRIVALTVDHGLRPESAQEAHQVRGWALERGIEHVILKWEGKKPISRISEKAREARYQLMTAWCRAHHIPFLLLGHHAQDQEETFWLRLSSGSGLDGLSGMKKQTIKEGITILRPLLTVPKERLQDILKAHDQDWIKDPSNEDEKFFRGRLRSFLKEEGLLPPRLLRTMEKLQEDADFIKSLLLTTLENSVELHPAGYISLRKDILEELHPALLKRVLSVCMQWFSGASYPPRAQQIQGLMNKLKMGLSLTTGGIYWFHQKEKIYLARELSASQPSLFLHAITEKTLWDQRFWIDPEIKKYLPEEAYLQCSGVAVGQYSNIEKLRSRPLDCSTAPRHSCLIPRRIWPTLPALWVKGDVVAIPYLCYNTLGCETDLEKFFNLKPLFHDLLRFTI